MATVASTARVASSDAPHMRALTAPSAHTVSNFGIACRSAIVVNVTVPTTTSFGAEFSADNHIISIAKESICSKTQLKEGDLVVQVLTRSPSPTHPKPQTCLSGSQPPASFSSPRLLPYAR